MKKSAASVIYFGMKGEKLYYGETGAINCIRRNMRICL